MVDDVFEALGCLARAALLPLVLRLAVLVAVGGLGAGGFFRLRIGEEVTMPLVAEEDAV